MRIISFVFCSLLLFAAVAQAQESPGPIVPGQVPHYCGMSVGEEAQAREAGNAFPWKIKFIFADEKTRSYLGNVELTVQDEHGAVWLQTLCDGAWIVIDLPEGRWKFSAVYNGTTKDREVPIGAGPMRTEYLFW